jgi:type I restriction enzyme S subunit
MNVLLSIKPKYANQIVKGNKKYEFRKSVFKNRDLEMVYIYSSSPVKRIIGAFAIKMIFSVILEAKKRALPLRLEM